jgi:hypothetical protein
MSYLYGKQFAAASKKIALTAFFLPVSWGHENRI